MVEGLWVGAVGSHSRPLKKGLFNALLEGVYIYLRTGD